MTTLLRLSMVICTLAFLSSCASIKLSDVLNPDLIEHELKSEGFFSDGKVVVLDISGEIADGESFLGSGDTSPDEIATILRKLEDDSDVKALLLRVNSPGGEVAASDTIYHEIKRFKEKKGIPVFTSVLSLGCSGAYYIGVLGDRIYAQPSSVVGSIGVIARIPKLKGLSEKIGYREEIYKSGGMKDMGHPLRDSSKEEKAVFQEMIDAMYERFLDVIQAERENLTDRDVLRTIADGRVYMPEVARQKGLIDRIGYLSDAIEDLRLEAGLQQYRVVTYKWGDTADTSIYSKYASINLLNIDLKRIAGMRDPGFYYLWTMRSAEPYAPRR